MNETQTFREMGGKQDIQQGQIELCLSRMREELDKATKTQLDIEEKLSVILRNEPPKDVAEKAFEDSLVPLALRIQEFTIQIVSTTNNYQSILSRMEL